MKDLFGSEIIEPVSTAKGNKAAVKLHVKLIAVFGPVDDKCKNCKHFLIKRYGGTYFKCKMTGHTNANPGTDWRANWPACGKFEANSK